MNVIRHLLAIAALPFTVAVLVPSWIARQNDTIVTIGATRAGVALQVAGVGVLMIGLTLFIASLRRFATDGQGTLAPWDPPRRLVVVGPYRYVRNPMISGVVFLLFGEALVLLSRPHAVWAVTVLIVNAIYIPLFEEPQLSERFGAAYVEYCRHVSRLLPRLRPWIPTSHDDDLSGR